MGSRRKKGKQYCEHCGSLLQRADHARCFIHRNRKKFPARYCGYCAKHRPTLCDGRQCLPKKAPATVTDIYSIRRGDTERDRALYFARVICAVRGISCKDLFATITQKPPILLARSMAVYLCAKHAVPDADIMSALRITEHMLRRDKEVSARRMRCDELFQYSIARAEEIIQRKR